MKNLMDMLSPQKEEETPMSEMEQRAKMEVLKDLFEMAMDMSGKNVANDMKGMQELTVAAPNKEGLMEGMETAEELMQKMPSDDEMPYDEEMSPEMMDEEEDEEKKNRNR